MISSNTRATRSRYSSPAQAQDGSWNGNGDPQERRPMLPSEASMASKAFMKSWLEPSVQTKASQEEEGMRYGVVDNLAPLGSLPKPKKTAESGQHRRKIILRQSAASAVNVPQESTHKAAAAFPLRSPSPPPPPAHPSSAPPLRRSLANKSAAAAAAAAAAGEEEDDEYDPKEKSRRRHSARVSLPKKARRTSAARRTSMSSAKAAAPTTNRPTWRAEPQDRDMVDKVVEDAVDEALKHYRYPTAWALRTLYDEKAGDPNFVAMVEDVFSQTADRETLEEFSRLMEVKKREGKKDNQGCYYFEPPATNNRLTPRKPKAAPYEKLLQRPRISQGRSESRSGETRAAKKVKLSHGSEPTTPRKMRANGGGRKSASKTPRSRKRARRDSATSESSLSSAMSLSSPEGGSGEAESASLSPSFRGGAAKSQGPSKSRPQPASTPNPKGRPITTRGKSVASSKHAVSLSASASATHALTTQSGSTPSHAPSRTHSASQPRSEPNARVPSTGDANMPSRLPASEQLPNPVSKPRGRPPKAVVAARLRDEDETEVEDNEGDAWNRRKEAQKVTNNYTAIESSVRPNREERDVTPARATRKTRQSLVAPGGSRATRSTSKRPSDDADDSIVSPLAFSFPSFPGLPGGFPGDDDSTVGSRAATPSSVRASKKPRTGLRVKSSPVKKKGGTAAGVPRSMGEAQASVNGGASKDQNSDNEESCSACGNAGDVVCCDGCPRSFHFECVDMVRSENLPDEWYCNQCLIKKYPSRVPVHQGSFASALNALEKTNSRAFSLPKKLQTRFEGVRAGTDGDYEEIVSGKPGKKKGGYEDQPDLFKQREDGQAVLCHDCQKPATEVQAIISCSVCPFHWHLDCLDPPLAVPPVLKTWKCPAHVDDVLMEAPRLAPAHRYRKVKGAKPITPALSRGVKNNGYIEIDWVDETDNDAGWPEPETFGRSYKLPAKGVVLDFIEQLRRQGAGYGPRQGESRLAPYLPLLGEKASLATRGSLASRTVEEMQASLNLVSLKQRHSEGIDQLTSALLAEADPNVVKLMAQGNADNIASGNLTASEKLSLQAILAQMESVSARIRQKLGEDTQTPSTPALAVQGSTPVSQAAVEEEVPVKMEPLAPAAEPTPPSTVYQAEGSMDLD